MEAMSDKKTTEIWEKIDILLFESPHPNQGTLLDQIAETVTQKSLTKVDPDAQQFIEKVVSAKERCEPIVRNDGDIAKRDVVVTLICNWSYISNKNKGIFH
ncbi:hypothetical protein GOBAR_DD06766 [Gossypium barbadense]|nr:hypothetical protein GOBAR_DD06766 [Gossypium barbadense]